MKKIISILLLLAMCIGCFAGCAPESNTTEDAGLIAAKDYLFAIYKDAEKVTSNDYTVVSQVMVEGVTYPVTWTADVSENIVKITAGDDGMTVIEINGTSEEVNYKLTATLKNEQGQEVSVSFDHIVPAKAQVSGKTMVLAYPKENKFITGSHYLYTGKNKWQLELTENEAEAIALEVVENDDDTVTLKAGDKYLYCDATHVKFVDTQDDYTKFILEAADTEGGYYVKCAVANYNGSPQYLEVYSGYLTCYGMGSDPSIYVFKLQETTTAAGTISGLDETPAPDGGNTSGGNTSGGNTSGGTTGGDQVDTNKTSATIYFTAEGLYVTGTEYIYNGKTTKTELTLSSKKADAIALTIKTNSDKTISFTASGKYLFCDGTDVKFVSSQSDNTKFVLESAGSDGKYFIKCAVANFQGKPQYLEVYSGYLTCYGMGSDASIYTFELKDTSGAKGKITSAGSSTGGNTSGGNTSGGNTSGGNTSGGNTSGGTTGGDQVDTNKTSGTIYFPVDGLYVTGTEYAYTSSSSGKTKIELTLSDKKADAIALTIKTNSDNTISFTAEGKYLFCDGTDVKFVSSQSDNTKFVLESAGTDKYFIKCAVANYQGKPQYLEVYSGYLTCYSMQESKADIYTFELKDTSGANGKITAASSSGGNTSGGNTSGGNTGSGTVDVDGKLAASLNMEGSANATSHTSTQTIYAANGIKYTNDKASSQTANIAPPDFSARAYKSSTVKVEYTGMVAIVFNLDDHNNGQYLTGFDGMTVNGATITRNGSTVTITFASATNVFQSAELGAQIRIKSIDVYTAN